MLTVKLSCQACGTEFDFSPRTFSVLGLAELPKQCPRCLDEKQNRPAEAVAVGRRCIEDWEAVRVCIPADLFQSFKAPGASRECFRAVIKGETLGRGVSWQGRIDIYCLAPTLPEVAHVRLMEVHHATGHKRVERHGKPLMAKTEVGVEYPATYTYLVIEPAEPGSEPTAALVFPSVCYKTTLKGLGRQYHASLDTSRGIWATRLSSSARSGRFGCYGAIAIVDDQHPVVTKQTGDVKSKRYFTLAHPDGCDEGEYLNACAIEAQEGGESED